LFVDRGGHPGQRDQSPGYAMDHAVFYRGVCLNKAQSESIGRVVECASLISSRNVVGQDY
jgi:hypothetical protein